MYVLRAAPASEAALFRESAIFFSGEGKEKGGRLRAKSDVKRAGGGERGTDQNFP
jgi:hypothetical protein